MWEPQRLTTLWAFTVCYRDSFTFLLLKWTKKKYLKSRNLNDSIVRFNQFCCPKLELITAVLVPFVSYLLTAPPTSLVFKFKRQVGL
jgi:hypothetical protein